MRSTRRSDPTPTTLAALLELDLHADGIRTIVWATGYRPDYSWLDVPVLDRKGYVVHDGGVVTGWPGLYVLGTVLLTPSVHLHRRLERRHRHDR